MGKGCSQYSMSITHTVYKVKLFILAQKFLMALFPWDEPTQVVLFLFGFFNTLCHDSIIESCLFLVWKVMEDIKMSSC